MALGVIGILAFGLFTLASVVFFGWLLVIGARGGNPCLLGEAMEWLLPAAPLGPVLSGRRLDACYASRPRRRRPTLVIAISLVVQGAFRIGAALSARVDGWAHCC